MAVLKAGTTVGGKRVLVEGDVTEPKNVTNNTSISGSISGSTNLPTMNTLRYAINRTTSAAAADTNYTTYMARGISLQTSSPSSITNGCIALVYT